MRLIKLSKKLILLINSLWKNIKLYNLFEFYIFTKLK